MGSWREILLPVSIQESSSLERGENDRDMSQEQQHHEPIYRTSSARVGRMMAIMLGICIVGGAIFFGMWDYWISEVPPVVSMATPVVEPTTITPTGDTITYALSFVEASDFITLAFNALPGEPDNNPTITANVGDEIVFDVVNDGVSFHAFGVTKETEGIGGIIPGTEVAKPADPLKPDESGTATFVPTEPGEYYYICTVPGHRAQGMEGIITVTEKEGGDSSDDTGAATSTSQQEPVTPTGQSHEFEVDFVEADDFITFGFNALPGDEGSNPTFTVNSGDQVTFTATNIGNSFHAFGIVADPTDFSNTLWDSEIASLASPMKPNESGSVTFTAGSPGKYYYICTVPGHAVQGMQGSFIVE